jgi:gamma-glutamyltranspeptidase/glutathione hydrolase
MVATSQPLAAMAGLRILLQGGNAMDAAVAVSAVLSVTEPHQTGLGADLFALVYRRDTGRVQALNASGPAPRTARLEDYLARGWHEIPLDSPWAWTVPGCVDGWHQMLKAHGTLPLRDVLTPAIQYAEDGFPVSPVDADYWTRHAARLQQDPGSRKALLIDGRLPRPGDVLVQKDLARTLHLLAAGGRDVFYRGEIADRLVTYSDAVGGLLKREDLDGYTAEWSEPIGTDYRGIRVLECPPNGQGLAALLALRAIGGSDLAALPRDSAECWHLLIEAAKLGLVQSRASVADPRFQNVPIKAMLSDRHTAANRQKLAAATSAVDGSAASRSSLSNTAYAAVVDNAGNAVSLICSVYNDFGTGHTVDGLGFLMQNRGACFSLDPAHPNRLAPGKRPYHTIIPSMLLKDGGLYACLGFVGGFMQPQGHLQLVVNLLDYGMDVQTAVDTLRFRWESGRQVIVEDGFPPETYAGLAARGHEVVRRDGHLGFGGAQIIARDAAQGVLVGGSEPRQDGCAVGY